MSDTIDLRNLENNSITVNNRIYVLGNPVISTQTLEQLVYALDQLGESTPVVIVNPEQSVIPDFDNRLSELIQQNRRTQPLNNTSADRYAFKDLTDVQLDALADTDSKAHPDWNAAILRETYYGLRERARALYYVDGLAKERDQLWALHCANPNSNEGSERYAEIVYKLIPEAQAVYNQIVARLETLNPQQQDKIAEKTTEMQQSSVTGTNNVTHQETASTLLVGESVEEELVQPLSKSTNTENKQKPWGSWLNPVYYKMPLSVAKELTQSTYKPLVAQQKNVEWEGRVWQAVPAEYILALGISVVYDGVPICYTQYGTFKRVGKSSVSPGNLNYWYPKPVVD